MSKRKREDEGVDHTIVTSVAARCRCPISESLLVDPVLCEDGHAYEREAIARWLASHATSPITRETLEGKTLVPHVALQQIVEDLVREFHDAVKALVP